MGKRIRYRFPSKELVRELNRLSKKYSFRKETNFKVIESEIILSPSDRITHIKKINANNEVVEVVNVSYEVNLDGEWLTIVRYDSSHGYLHRHVLISLDNRFETTSTSSVIKRGQPDDWYAWAITDIQKRFLEYRVGFMRRSKLPNLGY